MPDQSHAPVTVEETAPPPLGGTRAQAIQRLQVGGSLLIGIVLIVGLANVIENRAKQSDEAAVPEAAATVAPAPAAPSGTDPLADAGVVPDLPADTSDTPAAQASGPGREPDGGP